MIETTETLKKLTQHILQNQPSIESWFAKEWQKTPPPIYGSVDLRNAGFKIAPIDMNLFPAGFNNLNPKYLSYSIEAAEHVIKNTVPHAKKILLIPENHTRNLLYWENIATLISVLQQAGFEVKAGSLLPDFKEPTSLNLSNGKMIHIESIKKIGQTLQLNDFIPDLILLNNDLSDGIPDMLTNVNQPIQPPVELGWYLRLKSDHFQFYADVANEFGTLIEMDPWLISPLFRHCGELNFMRREGEACVAAHAEHLFQAIKQKYQQYQITSNPFIVIKADKGTYGMAVMTVRNIDEIQSLNRRQRTHMSKSKGGQPVQNVIIQEGIYSFETVGADKAVAEPVIYLWGEKVVGGFYRVHQDRSVDENLNSPGMKFEPLAFDQPCQFVQNNGESERNLFYIYGVIARLSMLAAAREMR